MRRLSIARRSFLNAPNLNQKWTDNSKETMHFTFSTLSDCRRKKQGQWDRRWQAILCLILETHFVPNFYNTMIQIWAKFADEKRHQMSCLKCLHFWQVQVSKLWILVSVLVRQFMHRSEQSIALLSHLHFYLIFKEVIENSHNNKRQEMLGSEWSEGNIFTQIFSEKLNNSQFACFHKLTRI